MGFGGQMRHGPSQRGQWTVWDLDAILDVPLCDHRTLLGAWVCRHIKRLACDRPGAQITVKPRAKGGDGQ